MRKSLLKRWMILLYGLLSYGLFVVTIGYGIAFFGNLFVGRTIDAAASVSVGEALLVNAGLLLLFALQHSGMARPQFKLWLSRFVAPVAERSTYVLFSSGALILMMALWQPMGGVVWSIDNALARAAIMAVYFGAWAMMIWATFLLDHFELFGLRQVWCAFHGRAPCREPAFQTPAAYRFTRHPIYFSWAVLLWASPIMTVSHLVVAVGLTAYIVFGIRLEERDLEQRLPYYRQYRRKVPMLVPSLWRRLR